MVKRIIFSRANDTTFTPFTLPKALSDARSVLQSEAQSLYRFEAAAFGIIRKTHQALSHEAA